MQKHSGIVWLATVVVASSLSAACTAGQSGPTSTSANLPSSRGGTVASQTGGSPSPSGSATPTGPTGSATGTSTPTGSSTPTPTDTATPDPGTGTPSVGTGPQLPMGGYTIFPKYRVIAYYGNGQSTALGVLGHFPAEVAATKVAAVARQWATPQRPTVPAMELIVSVADGGKGDDGNYSHDTSDAVIERYLSVVRKHHQLLVLDIQPGRQEFLPVVQRYEKFLAMPDVGVALDPEWRMGPSDVPGRVIGHVDAPEINAVSDYLAALTQRNHLPQKILMLHNFTGKMIQHPETVLPRPGLAIIWHVDGFGDWSAKVKVYSQLHKTAPFFNGFKLFYTLDHPLATSARVQALKPSPDFISYQ